MPVTPTLPTPDSPEVRARRDRLSAIHRARQVLKVTAVVGPELPAAQYELLQTADAALIDLELALANEGIREMVG